MPPASSADITIVQHLLEAYGLAGARILESASGYRNTTYPVRLVDGRLLNLILYKNETGILDKIQSANRVSNYLAAQGFPTRTTAGPSAVLRAGRVARYACLYDYLPGHTIPWEAYTKDHVKLLGLTMSQLHATLALSPLRLTA